MQHKFGLDTIASQVEFVCLMLLNAFLQRMEQDYANDNYEVSWNSYISRASCVLIF